MAGKRVVAVHVHGIQGKARIEAGAYRQIVDDAVRPIREGESDLPDVPYDDLAKERRRAVRNGTIGFLQDTGDLFPTE